MLKRLLSLGAAAIATVVAACEEGPSSVSGTWRSPATWSSMTYASAKGPLLLEVLGNPFASVAADDLAPLAAQAMSGQVIGRQLTFTTDRGQAPQPGFRVVLAFNVPVNTDAKKLCAGTVSHLPAGERVAVMASFCADGDLLASVRGWVARIEGPSDQRFLQLLGQMTRELFGTAP